MKRALIALAACAAAFGSSPRAWEMNSYRDFLAGRFEGVSLGRDGRLTLAPRTETVFSSDQPILWSIAQAPDGSIYAGTGHRGRVLRIDRAGKGEVVWTAQEPEVFAVALDGKGILYAATSPNGRIYRIEAGKAQEYFAPGAAYIWTLAFGRDGALYAGTGDQGRVYRITAPGKGEVWYETGQSHVTALGFDAQGRLLAGSEPNGILYRISAKDKGFVLYDANLPEIRSIATAPDGAIYAAALGGSMGRRQLGGVQSSQGVPSSASVTVTSTSVTVEAAQPVPSQGGVQLQPKADASKTAAASAPSAAMPSVEISGVEKSAIYRIAPDHTVESVWSSKEENAYDLLLSGGDILIATDQQGRIYRMGPDRKTTLLVQTNEGEATRLLGTRDGVLAATGDMGKLLRLTGDRGGAGVYEAPVHDAGTAARWGRLRWRGDVPAGTRVAFRTRSGNSGRPDATWSDWSAPLTEPDGSAVPSPNARYIQWKMELAGAQGKAPVLESVDLAYLPQNTPPVVRSITAVPQPAGATSAKTAAQQTQAASAYTVTVTDTGEAAGASAGTPTQAVGRSGAEQLQITWQAEDPDGDRMVYALYFRGEGESDWKLLKDKLFENTWAIDADALADGRYFFKVVAADSPANAPGTAREADLISSPTLVDNTPPVITAGPPQRTGSRLEVEFSAADSASALRRGEYAVDGGLWVPVEPVDGVPDSPSEKFVLRIDGLPAGEHLVVFRATDAAGNAGLGKVVVR